jgi:hypothetical protein
MTHQAAWTCRACGTLLFPGLESEALIGKAIVADVQRFMDARGTHLFVYNFYETDEHSALKVFGGVGSDGYIEDRDVGGGTSGRARQLRQHAEAHRSPAGRRGIAMAPTRPT